MSRLRTLLVAPLVLVAALCGCSVSEAEPEAADVSSAFSATEQMRSMLEGVSAAKRSTYIPHAADALAWVELQLKEAGVANPHEATFVLRVKTFALTRGVPFDHSEIDIETAYVEERAVPLKGRILGDWWGAGLYKDTLFAYEVGPSLCVSFEELRAAIRAAYVPGSYLTTFVCHNVTSRVLDSLEVSTRDYPEKIRGWQLAAFAFGPTPHTAPAAATESTAARTCRASGVQ